MAIQPKRKKYSASRSLLQHQGDIAFQETIYLQVTDLLTEPGSTISVHDNRTPVPPNSLELVEDPNGTATGSSGSTLIKRGKAFISGTEKKVSAFRKATVAASGAGGAAPAPPAPTAPGAPTVPVAPGPVDDQGTGPEGNPDLNSDGTPRTIATNPASDEDG